MYKKKLTYSFFSIPVAIATYNICDWHKRRMSEKLSQIQVRSQRISEEPSDIQNHYINNQFPWMGLDVKQFNTQFAYKPIELHGQFDHSKQVLVEKIHQGEEGFDIITPFYCYVDETGKVQPVLVNRGWISYDEKTSNAHMANNMGPISIKGCLYQGDGSNKYSKKNDIAAEKFYTQKPDEIATYMCLPNKKLASQFVVKQVEFNPVNRTSLPLVYNVSELGQFPITPETNLKYANLWKYLTFGNLFSNMMVWVYL